MRQITIANLSPKILSGDLAKTVAALQTQLDSHFEPLWGIPCKLILAETQPKGEAIYLVDSTSVAGALGYHTVSNTDSPFGIVQMDLIAQYQEDYRAVLGHEILEQLVDPYCNLMVPAPWAGLKVAALALEVCDPVESSYYMINDVPVPNFVTPQFFQYGVVNAQYDHLNLLPTSLSLLHGGYQVYSPDMQNWTETFAEGVSDFRQASKRHSRKAMRFFGRRF